MEASGRRYIYHKSRSDQISIWNLSDWHWGSRSCHVRRLQEDINRIRDDPYSFWFGGGDYADYISPRDKRWSAGELDESITVKQLGSIGRVQCDRVKEFMEPIKHKCLGLLLGNHETKYMGAQEQCDLHGYLCTSLGVQNLGYCAFTDIVFLRTSKFKTPKLLNVNLDNKASAKTVRFFLHHGFSGAITPGGKLNSLIKAMTQFDADVYMMGHVHDQKGQRNVRLGADASCTNLIHKETIGVITGAYLMTYAQGSSSYGEQKGYAPCPLGAVRVVVTPSTGEIRGEV